MEYAQSLSVQAHMDEFPTSKIPYDLCVSAYYSNFIPKAYYKDLSIGSINIHPSMLPEYKGCSSLTWAIANGEKKTGISYHELTDRFDEGKVYHQESLEINQYDFQLNLYHRAMHVASMGFEKALNNLIQNKYYCIE